MKLLLDTHTLLWWLYGDPKLSVKAQEVIQDETNTVFVSSASAWEISTKYRIGKLPHAQEAAENLKHHLTVQKFSELPITMRHAQHAGLLPGDHRDPFDRMLVAQAILDNLVMVSNEKLFDQYTIQRHR